MQRLKFINVLIILQIFFQPNFADETDKEKPEDVKTLGGYSQVTSKKKRKEKNENPYKNITAEFEYGKPVNQFNAHYRIDI